MAREFLQFCAHQTNGNSYNTYGSITTEKTPAYTFLITRTHVEEHFIEYPHIIQKKITYLLPTFTGENNLEAAYTFAGPRGGDVWMVSEHGFTRGMAKTGRLIISYLTHSRPLLG